MSESQVGSEVSSVEETSEEPEVITRWLPREYEIHHHHWDFSICCVTITTIVSGVLFFVLVVVGWIRD